MMKTIHKITFKVARVVNLKLILTESPYAILLLMQNPIPKLRRRSIISKKPGFFV